MTANVSALSETIKALDIPTPLILTDSETALSNPIVDTIRNNSSNKNKVGSKEPIFLCGDPKCSKSVPENGDSLFCDFCQKWYHFSCTDVDKDSFNFLSKTTQSIFWKCSFCPSLDKIVNVNLASNFSKFEQILNNRLEKIETNISKKINLAYSVQNKSGENSKKMSNSNVLKNNVVPQKLKMTETPIDDKSRDNKSVCNHYRMGTCHHGSSGKKIINGKTCPYDHPPKCKKFCRFGKDGCAGSCGLFHPILCRTSILHRECFNVNCTFAHLQGTRRYRLQVHGGDYNNRLYSSNQISNNNIYRARTSHSSNFRKPDFQKNTRFSSNDFPPLSHSHYKNDEKLNEVGLAVKKLQESVGFLLQLSGSSNPGHAVNHQPVHYHSPPEQNPFNHLQSTGPEQNQFPPHASHSQPAHLVDAKNYSYLN